MIEGTRVRSVTSYVLVTGMRVLIILSMTCQQQPPSWFLLTHINPIQFHKPGPRVWLVKQHPTFPLLLTHINPITSQSWAIKKPPPLHHQTFALSLSICKSITLPCIIQFMTPSNETHYYIQYSTNKKSNCRGSRCQTDQNMSAIGQVDTFLTRKQTQHGHQDT
jgi:hypothetical protein